MKSGTSRTFKPNEINAKGLTVGFLLKLIKYIAMYNIITLTCAVLTKLDNTDNTLVLD